jgi:hypothetical protein
MEEKEYELFKDLKNISLNWQEELDKLTIKAGSGTDSINLSDDTMDNSFNIGAISGASGTGISLSHQLNNNLWGNIQPLTTQQISQLNTISIHPISQPYINTTSGYSNLNWQNGYGNSATLEVQGDANFKGDIKLQGKSLGETLDNIEKRLAILHPNPKLEEKWETLKSLGEQYRELEKDIIEKEKLWSMLKK